MQELQADATKVIANLQGKLAAALLQQAILEVALAEANGKIEELNSERG